MIWTAKAPPTALLQRQLSSTLAVDAKNVIATTNSGGLILTKTKEPCAAKAAKPVRKSVTPAASLTRVLAGTGTPLTAPG